MNEIRNIITERVDDIPLLLGQMQRRGLPTLLKDKIVCSLARVTARRTPGRLGIGKRSIVPEDEDVVVGPSG